jgi:hypothetical protein
VTGVFLVSCDGAYLGKGLGVGFWGFISSNLLNLVPSDKSVFVHNFLISQDLSLISLRIALSIPELHESKGDLQNGARIT